MSISIVSTSFTKQRGKFEGKALRIRGSQEMVFRKVKNGGLEVSYSRIPVHCA